MGKNPVHTAEEAGVLLDSIKMVRKRVEVECAETEVLAFVELRDLALIGDMVWTFARVNALLQMKVRDDFVEGLRRWGQLHEKGDKEHKVSCHHKVEKSDEYIASAGIGTD